MPFLVVLIVASIMLWFWRATLAIIGLIVLALLLLGVATLLGSTGTVTSQAFSPQAIGRVHPAPLPPSR